MNGTVKAPAIAIVGQPFTVNGWSIPVNATLTCNCASALGGAGTIVQIVNGAPATCTNCQRLYAAAFNAQTGQLQVGICTPTPEKEPS